MCYGETITSAFHRARKIHRCGICERPIKAGTKYERAVTKEDGMLWTHKTHPRCVAIWNALWSQHGEDMCYTDPVEAIRVEAQEGGREFKKLVRKAVEAMRSRHPELMKELR